MSARDGCIGQDRKGGNEIARKNTTTTTAIKTNTTKYTTIL